MHRNMTHSMPAMTQYASQLLRKSVTTFVDDTPPMPTRPQSASQHVLNLPTHASNEKKRISNFVDQTQSIHTSEEMK